MGERTTRRRWASWGVVVLGYLFAFFQRLSLNTAGVDVSRSFGWTAAQLGLLGSVYFLAASVMRIPAGLMTDRWGARRGAFLSLVLGGVGAVAFSAATSLGVAALGRALAALGDAAIFVSLVRLQADGFRPDEFATLSGLSLFVAGIGFWLTTTPLALALARVSWRTLYAGVGGFLLFLAVLARLIIPGRGGAALAAAGAATRPVSLAREILVVVRNRHAWPPILVFMALYSIWTELGAAWGIPYWHTARHLTVAEAAARFTLFVALFAIGSGSLGRLSDRWRNRRAFLLVAGVLVASGVGAMLAFQALPGAAALLVFAVIGVATGVTPVCYASMRENNPPESAALSVAVLLTGSDLAAALTQYLVGHLAAAHPADAFRLLWWVLLGWALLWVVGATGVRETRAANRWYTVTVEAAPGRPCRL